MDLNETNEQTTHKAWSLVSVFRLLGAFTKAPHGVVRNHSSGHGAPDFLQWPRATFSPQRNDSGLPSATAGKCLGLLFPAAPSQGQLFLRPRGASHLGHPLVQRTRLRLSELRTVCFCFCPYFASCRQRSAELQGSICLRNKS